MGKNKHFLVIGITLILLVIGLDGCIELQTNKNNTQDDLRNGSILEVPIPDDFHCFLYENRNNSECLQYYEEECSPDGSQCWKVLACSKYYNPVYDANGLFYPSACWAEHLGTSVESYGYSDSLKQFISDLWLTKKQDGKSFFVPSPNIEFTYTGGGWVGYKSGAWFRSTLWENSTNFYIMDFDIKTNRGNMSTSRLHIKTFNPVMGNTLKSLLVFVMFDDAFPEQVLLNWTETYASLMNDYIRKKQQVSNPIQYNITPVVISPPQGVERTSANHSLFTNEEQQMIYDAAIEKIGLQDFKMFIVSPIGGFGGYYTTWNNMEFIHAPLTPPDAYSATDKKAGLDALAAFQQMFHTISHEVLHAVGLPGDHMPMGYGTYYLDYVGQNVDPITGKEITGPTKCEFLGNSSEYYSVEVPSNLKIFVGQEPDWLIKEECSSGDLLKGLYNNEYLKDYDGDGEYKIMYKNNLIGIELQRSLGWVDIDGDGIAELEDLDAYGGYKELEEDSSIEINTWSTFEPLEEISINGSKFEKIRLEDGREGLVPLRCAEFNSDIVNLYKNVQYGWQFVQKEYGTVLLPRLNWWIIKP